MVEGELLALALFVLYLFTRLLGQDWRLNLSIFFLGACWGFVAQLLLGVQWNRYSANVRFYIGYVSFALIVTWGIGLMAIFCLAAHLSRRLFGNLKFWVHFLVTLPMIILIEFLGSNLLQMKLYDYTRFRPILPFLNAMHAPVWFFGYYFLVNSTFYFGLKFLGVARRFYRAADH